MTEIPSTISDQIKRVTGNRWPATLSMVSEAIEEEDDAETLRRLYGILRALSYQAQARMIFLKSQLAE